MPVSAYRGGRSAKRSNRGLFKASDTVPSLSVRAAEHPKLPSCKTNKKKPCNIYRPRDRSFGARPRHLLVVGVAKQAVSPKKQEFVPSGRTRGGYEELHIPTCHTKLVKSSFEEKSVSQLIYTVVYCFSQKPHLGSFLSGSFFSNFSTF